MAVEHDNKVLRTVFLDAEMDDVLRRSAYRQDISKGELIRRYVEQGIKTEQVRFRPAPAGAGRAAKKKMAVKAKFLLLSKVKKAAVATKKAKATGTTPAGRKKTVADFAFVKVRLVRKKRVLGGPVKAGARVARSKATSGK